VRRRRVRCCPHPLLLLLLLLHQGCRHRRADATSNEAVATPRTRHRSSLFLFKKFG